MRTCKVQNKVGRYFDQPVCQRCVKLSPLKALLPSRLIKVKITLEEAVITKGLLIIQRPLHCPQILSAHTLHLKKHQHKYLHIRCIVPAEDEQHWQGEVEGHVTALHDNVWPRNRSTEFSFVQIFPAVYDFVLVSYNLEELPGELCQLSCSHVSGHLVNTLSYINQPHQLKSLFPGQLLVHFVLQNVAFYLDFSVTSAAMSDWINVESCISEGNWCKRCVENSADYKLWQPLERNKTQLFYMLICLYAFFA